MKKMLSFMLAAIGIGFAIYRVTVMGQSAPTPPPLQEPARTPYRDSVAGQGIIEAARENVSIAPLVPGVVTKVFVKQWDRVKTGDPLFQLDDRDLQAELGVREAAARAQAERVARLKAMPRPEDIPPLEANVRQAEARLRDHLDQLARLEGVDDTAAVSQDELKRKRFDVEVARRQLEKAQADLKQLEAGAWRYDIQQAEADHQLALSQAEQARINRSRLLVRAARDGTILQVNIRPGEYVSTTPATPPILLGDTNRLQARVDVDEVNADRVAGGASAVASLKGDATKTIPLKFVRIEPYIVPKKSLTGGNTERVDMRVLQVIYEFSPPKFPVYVGQQVDVFLEGQGAGVEVTQVGSSSDKGVKGGVR